MSSDQITFFDLPSKSPCKTWSLNPWKTRFVLNYKGLDYKTEWVEYPNVRPLLEKHVSPNKEGPWSYTIPTVRLPDGTYIMESRVIANKLEELHPSPSLHLDSPYLAKLEELMPQFRPGLAGIFIPLVPKRLLNDASMPYWYETREKAFGMKLDQLATEQGGDIGWKKAEPVLKKVTELLKENSSGPFFMGDKVSYADFVWAGFLIFFRRIGQDVFHELLSTTGDVDVHVKLLEGVRPWSERDSY